MKKCPYCGLIVDDSINRCPKCKADISDVKKENTKEVKKDA